MATKFIFISLICVFLLGCSGVQMVPVVNAQQADPTGTHTMTLSYTPKPSTTPNATWIPCSEDLLTPEPLPNDIEVIYYDKVTAAGQCNDIAKYSMQAKQELESAGFEVGPLTVHVFTDYKAFAPVQRQIVKDAGCNPDSRAEIEKTWEGKMTGGQSTGGAIFLLAGPGWPSYDKASTISHEVTQVAMINILGSCERKWEVHDWFAHGLAEFNAEAFPRRWGLGAGYKEDICFSQSLEEMMPGAQCIYTAAQKGIELLVQGPYECSTPMDVILHMGQNNTGFETSFSEVCGVTVEEFSDDFDVFRSIRYKLTSTPLPTVTPTKTPVYGGDD
jgi:hypothetical protein